MFYFECYFYFIDYLLNVSIFGWKTKDSYGPTTSSSRSMGPGPYSFVTGSKGMLIGVGGDLPFLDLIQQ